ncbi:MAG: segregation and condensation protein A [Chromatiales bacterium]
MSNDHDLAGPPHPEQEEMPFAVVQGVPLTELPKDLYIPPDALAVFLEETFEGPLDLLLYLIKRQNLDILDIPIAQIARQYMAYMELMQELHLELAAEYLVMAAMLAEIKSRMLLPRPVEKEEEEDPRAELVRRLQEYERYKKAAEDIDQLPRIERDHYCVVVPFPERRAALPPPPVSLADLLAVFSGVLARASLFADHRVQREPLSVRERMSTVLERVTSGEFVQFTSLFNVREGRAGVIVTLLAILELLKSAMIEMVQNELHGPLYVKAVV